MFQVKRESNCQSRIQYPEKDISDMPRPRVYQLLTVTKRPTKLNFSKYSQLLIAKTPQKPNMGTYQCPSYKHALRGSWSGGKWSETAILLKVEAQ